MTLKIEFATQDSSLVIRLIGRIEREHLAELDMHVRRHGPRLAIDLGDVTLVDAAVVRFLLAREAEGFELRSAAQYIREWMERERSRQP